VRAFACFLLLVIGSFAAAASAAPFAVQLGDARIGLDAPPGFADTGFTGSPRLLELAESLTSPSNRILLFAISDGDLRRFTLGDPPEFRRYMIAVTPKGLEREHVTRSLFAAFVAESLRGLDEPTGEGDPVKLLDARPAGQPALLAELRKDPDTVSILQGTRVPGRRASDKPVYGLSTTTLLLLRGKALSLSVFTAFDEPADHDWIRAVTLRWIDDLKRLNSRH
jgi:hypothetical protein